MFRRITPQWAVHSSGFEVYTKDHSHLAYKEGDHVALVEVEFSPVTLLVYTETLTHWEPPHEGEPFPDEKRKEILDRISATLTWQKDKFKFY